MARLSIALLGPFRLHQSGKPVTGLESDKVRALLSYLALEIDRPISRQSLASLLWPERPDRAARHDLSQALYSLRHAIDDRDMDPPFLVVTRQTVQFNPLSDHWLDVAAFIELIQACRQHLHRRLDLCKPCIERLHQLTDLYQGHLLEGFSLGDSLPFEEWLLFQRERFHRLAVRAVRSLVRCHERHGEHGQALRYARHYVALEPCQEEAHRQVMGALAATGQRSAALAQYETCQRTLKTELGVEPEEKTKTLHRRICDGKESLISETLSPRNLPAPILPFVGRATELAWIKAHLRDPNCRLLTLVGPGGMGKTRLALEAGSDLLLSDVELTDQALLFPQGIYFVPLAPLKSHEGIVPALAEVLGFSFYRGEALGHAKTTAAPCPRQQVLDYVRDRQVLLILDGFEHLIEGATLVSELLHAAPGVKVLVTSRVRLNLQGERIYPVPALRVPSPTKNCASEVDRIRQCDAVELFSKSARCVRPGFEVDEDGLQEVAQICRLTQGIPLAILLAAAWVETLSPGQIATQLVDRSVDFLHADWRDIPQRQRSMRAVLDRSWSLLAQRQQETLAKLSVFHGGFTDKAAHQIASASRQDLVALARRSLLRQHTTDPASAGLTFPYLDTLGQCPRTGSLYEMHELLRQYAAEKLEGMSTVSQMVRERHADYYAVALHRWESDLKSEQQQRALAEMGVEIENVRAAWTWAIQRRHVETLEKMADGLGLFYEWGVRYEEGERAFRVAADGLVGSPEGWPNALAVPLLVRVRALAWQGRFCSLLGRADRAKELVQQGFHLLDDVAPADPLARQDPRRERAFVLQVIGEIEYRFGERSKAEPCFEQSLALCRALGDRWQTANALFVLGMNAQGLGSWSEAMRLLQEGLESFRALGDRRGMADSLVGLAFVHQALGRFAEAERLEREGLAICRSLGDQALLAWVLQHLGSTLFWCGKFTEANLTFGECLAICQDLGSLDEWSFANTSLARVKAIMGQYRQAQGLAQRGLELAYQIGVPWRIGQALLTLSGPLLAQKDFTRAQRLLKESADLFQKIGARDGMGWSLALLGCADCGQGDLHQARQHLCKALQLVLEIRFTLVLMFVLPAAALLFSCQGRAKRAVQIYAVASRWAIVANSRLFEDIFGQYIATAAATLPPVVVAEAQERGRKRDPWSTAQEVLIALDE